MTSPGPHAAQRDDLTGRMALFGRLFARTAGLPEPALVPSPEDAVTLVRAQVPRETGASTPAPVYEAAAYLGEWLRRDAGGEWVAPENGEPHLQLTDRTGAIIVLLPLVRILRTAATAGYDGLAALLRSVRDDVAAPARSTSLDGLRVAPEEERATVVAWVRANRDLANGTRIALWRRCGACGSMQQDALALPPTGVDWETDAGVATGMLAMREFECACGGAAGDVSRVVMLRREDAALRLGDIRVAPTHTRVACWTLDGDGVTPLDARGLAHEPAAA